MGQVCGKEKPANQEGKGNGNVEGLNLKPLDPESVTSVVNENVSPDVKSVPVNVNTFANPDVIEEAKPGIPEDLPEPPQDLAEENSNSKEKKSPKTPRNSTVEPAIAVINTETPKADTTVDKPEAEKPNDDSVLAFGAGDPNIPSDNVTDLVTQYLDKIDDDDDDDKKDQKEKNDAGDSVLFFGDGDPNIPSDKVIDLVTNHLDEIEEKKAAVEEEKIDPSFTVVDKPEADAPSTDIQS